MLGDQQLGNTTSGLSFADIIINSVSSVADGTLQGFAQFVHDPVSLKAQVQSIAKQAISTDFADAVVQRRLAAEGLDSLWQFPLNMQTPTTCPMPWTFVEASLKNGGGANNTAYEFDLMRTVDFIGRNFLKITLPEMNTVNIKDSAVSSGEVQAMADPKHTYLGAWHSEIIPRLIEKLEFYTRSNSHKLFEYSGTDIFIHNILFGNAHKEMNDLAAGEDKFELCYDPYRVDGSAMGIASYKGIDTYMDWSEDSSDATTPGATKYTPSASRITGTPDGFVDYFQLDTTMDDAEFRDVYRHNVWYEAPIARNYFARHSIHERRVYHQAKDIVIPLDILPFGYSIASSLPTAAIGVECGFIKVKLFNNWLDRCFYLTKFSDVPSKFFFPDHRHYEASDVTPDGDALSSGDARIGWVNERSIGRGGDPSFTKAAEDTVEPIPFSTTGSLLGTDATIRENIIPTRVTPTGSDNEIIRTSKGMIATKTTQVKRGGFGNSRSQTTTSGLSTLARSTPLTDSDSSSTSFIHKLSDIDRNEYTSKLNEIRVKLLQVGYQTLPCIREYFSKLPNIYVTTEWADTEYDITNIDKVTIQNDLFIQAVVLWAIPEDANGIKSMRVFPHHTLHHENPVIAGIKLINDNSQGTTFYDWTMLNIMNPQQMDLNPLMENMGVISFSPSIKPNAVPFAFYDTNIASVLKMEFLKGENVDYRINLKKGSLLVTCIGVNGIANVNLSCYRLVF